MIAIPIKAGNYRVTERVVPMTVAEVSLPAGCVILAALETHGGAVRLIVLEPIVERPVLTEEKRGKGTTEGSPTPPGTAGGRELRR